MKILKITPDRAGHYDVELDTNLTGDQYIIVYTRIRSARYLHLINDYIYQGHAHLIIDDTSYDRLTHTESKRYIKQWWNKNFK